MPARSFTPQRKTNAIPISLVTPSGKLRASVALLYAQSVRLGRFGRRGLRIDGLREQTVGWGVSGSGRRCERRPLVARSGGSAAIAGASPTLIRPTSPPLSHSILESRLRLYALALPPSRRIIVWMSRGHALVLGEIDEVRAGASDQRRLCRT